MKRLRPCANEASRPAGSRTGFRSGGPPGCRSRPEAPSDSSSGGMTQFHSYCGTKASGTLARRARHVTIRFNRERTMSIEPQGTVTVDAKALREEVKSKYREVA